MIHRSTLNRIFLAAALAAAALLCLFILNRPQKHAWTLAFYLDGSGNLLAEQQKNLREIVRGFKNVSDIQVVVCLDRGTSPSFPMVHGWKGPRIFHVDGDLSRVLTHPVEPERFAQGFSGPADGLSRFFSLVRNQYPARHYAFFISGHGSGWTDMGDPSGMDYGFSSKAIKQGLSSNEPDILCLDLCFMADLASLYQLKDSARYLVMAQGPFPASGQDYTALFELIAKKNHAEPDAMAAMIYDSARQSLVSSKLNSAVSLIRTGPPLDLFFSDFKTLMSDDAKRRQVISQDGTFVRLPRWGGIAHQMIDLKNVLEAFPHGTGASPLNPASFVLATFSTSDKASGLSLFYPADHAAFLKFRKDYANLDFTLNAGSPWLALLDEKHGREQASLSHPGTNP